MNAHLDIIIVTFNNADTISPCLHSIVAAQEELQIHLILVDNNSSDRTLEIANTICRKFNTRPTIIKNDENLGFTKATNQGLCHMRGSHVLFLNPDTQFEKGVLSGLVMLLDAEQGTGVVAPQLINEDGSVQPSCRRFPRRRDVLFNSLGLHVLFPKSALFNGWKMGDFNHLSPKNVEQPQGAFLLATATLVRKIGDWDEKYPMFFSDVDWCQRVIKSGYRIRFSPEFQVTHAKGASVYRYRWRMILTSHRSFIRYYWRSYRGWYSIGANVAVTMLLLFVGFIRVLLSWLISVFKRAGIL